MKLSCLLLVWTTKSSRIRCLVGALGAERRVREDDVEALAARRLVDRVAECDVRLDLVEVQVHQRQPARPSDEFLAEVGLLADALRGSRSKAPPVSSLSHS